MMRCSPHGEKQLTGRDIRVHLNFMRSIVERCNFKIKIGRDQRLPLEVIRCDGRQEGDIQLNHVGNIHGENALC